MDLLPASLLLISLLLLVQVDRVPAVRIPADKLKLIEQAKMSEKQAKRVHNMHVNWYIRAVNSLMGAVGREMFLKMSKVERAAFIRCLDAIEEEHDLQAGAQCLVAAWDKRLDYKSVVSDPAAMHEKKPAKLNIRKLSHMKSIVVRHRPPPTPVVSKRFERLRKRVNRIQPTHFGMTYTNQVKENVRKRLKRAVNLNNPDDRDEYTRMFPSEFQPRRSAKPPDLHGPPKVEPKSFVRQMTNMFGTVLKAADANNTRLSPWKQSYSHLKKLNELMRTHRDELQYSHRMLDTVVDHDEKYRRRLPFMKRFRQLQPEPANMPRMLKDTYELVDSLNKHTEMLNAKILSPRFASLVDDNRDKDTVHLLSPRVFSLYKDDSPNAILPLPDVVDAFGLRADDKDAVLELIMDASGANEIVKDAFNIFSTNETAQLMSDVDGVTETLNAIYDGVKQLFAPKQRRDLAQRKYTFINPEQAEMLYGEKGPYNNTLGIDLKDYAEWSEVEKRRVLMHTIRKLANGVEIPSGQFGDQAEGGDSRGRRRKRALTTLAPFAFAPAVLAPAFLGPVTLSPNLFSPSIISPTALSPPVLTPSVGSPLIISPYVFSPNTISPAVFEVYILSPYCIAPNVINPYVMSPIILSPHVLSPDVMSSTVLSGAILNPFVLGPAVLTQSALAADILSPSFLSKK
ncbi:hypothetical protein M3Y99_01837800 [Aphelenchoides fujianensis]|nr:hypothetical protein M3Y99_01837800 [Aphelenchoides fujianensis]